MARSFTLSPRIGHQSHSTLFTLRHNAQRMAAWAALSVALTWRRTTYPGRLYPKPQQEVRGYPAVRFT